MFLASDTSSLFAFSLHGYTKVNARPILDRKVNLYYNDDHSHGTNKSTRVPSTNNTNLYSNNNNSQDNNEMAEAPSTNNKKKLYSNNNNSHDNDKTVKVPSTDNKANLYSNENNSHGNNKTAGVPSTNNKENLYSNNNNSHGNDTKEENNSKANNNNDKNNVTIIGHSKKGVGLTRYKFGFDNGLWNLYPGGLWNPVKPGVGDINDNKNVLQSPHFVTPTSNTYAALTDHDIVITTIDSCKEGVGTADEVYNNKNTTTPRNNDVVPSLKQLRNNNFVKNYVTSKLGVDNNALAQEVNKINTKGIVFINKKSFNTINPSKEVVRIDIVDAPGNDNNINNTINPSKEGVDEKERTDAV